MLDRSPRRARHAAGASGSKRHVLAGAAFAAGLLVAQPALRAEAEGASRGLAIGAGDRLTITVFGQAELTGDYLVADDGRISMPLVGGIEVAGLPLADVQKRIATQLADGYLKEPIVGARVAELRPISVVGDVRAPGSYPFRYGASVLGAVALAGGYGRVETPGADRTSDFLLADERVRSLEIKQGALAIKISRLSAQRDGAAAFEPVSPSGLDPAEFKRIATVERQIFDTDRKALAEELETLSKQRPRIQADIKATNEQLEAEKTQLDLIRDHIAGFNQLMSSGYARRYTGIELQREEARNRGNVARLNSELARLDLAILEVDLRIAAARSRFAQRILAELDGASSQAAEIRVSLPTARELRAAKLQNAGSGLARTGAASRKIVVIRARDGEGKRVPADEMTPLLPGDIVEVTTQPEPSRELASGGGLISDLRASR